MSDEPKYRAIAEGLRADIAAGRLPVGGRMPTKAVLMGQYSVALGTIDRALSDLRRDGLIRSEQGAGTFVLKAPDQVDPRDARIAELEQRIDELEVQVMELRANAGFDTRPGSRAEATA